jgi:hypothetical protein
MRDRFVIAALLGVLALAVHAPATTIERLTVDEMIAKSTLIVRGKSAVGEGVRRGGIIYTEYVFRVEETIKGSAPATLRLTVPGGTVRGASQMFAGTPRLEPGQDYVVFVWTSRGGVHHIIGLSQGLFDAKVNSAGEWVLRRGPASAHVVDQQGKEIADQALELNWSEVKRRVRGAGVVR